MRGPKPGNDVSEEDPPWANSLAAHMSALARARRVPINLRQWRLNPVEERTVGLR